MRATCLLATAVFTVAALPVAAQTSGAGAPTHEGVAAEPQRAPIELYLEDVEPRSVPRRTAGQVLVVLSGVSLLGATVIGTSQECSVYGCFVHWLFTIPLAVQGGVLGAIGIPLWVSGAGEVPINGSEEAAVAPAVIPEIQVGAGALGFGLRF